MPTTPSPRKRQSRMRHCFNCGEEIGVSADYEPLDTCGRSECEREARYAQIEREERSHDELDYQMGWGRYRDSY
jgi:hypothetical protein